MKAALALAAALAAAACGPRPWNYDETDRIADVMIGDTFDPDLPEARGIPLYQMPPQARPSPRSLTAIAQGAGHKFRVRSLTPPREQGGAASGRGARKAKRPDRDRAAPKVP